MKKFKNPFTTDDLPGEIWREYLPGYFGSNYGRLKSTKKGKFVSISTVNKKRFV